MHTRFLAIVAFAMVVAFPSWRAFCATPTTKTERWTIHGRLRVYNGTPSCRIWIVGTKRLLGVRQSSDEVPFMPKGLRDLLSWDREIFADFLVEALTPYKPGVMQIVRVLAASKIVVTEKGTIVLRKKKL